MESITLLLDNDFETSLTDFIKENTADDVCPISSTEFNMLTEMEIGDELYIGFSEVKRIK